MKVYHNFRNYYDAFKYGLFLDKVLGKRFNSQSSNKSPELCRLTVYLSTRA